MRIKEVKLNCVYCVQSGFNPNFKNFKELRKHIKDVHSQKLKNSKKPVYKCAFEYAKGKECRAEFKSINGLLKHYKEAHLEKPEPLITNLVQTKIGD